MLNKIWSIERTLKMYTLLTYNYFYKFVFKRKYRKVVQ